MICHRHLEYRCFPQRWLGELSGTTAPSFQYDGLSRMTLSSDSVGSVAAGAGFFFDSLGRVIEEVQSYGS
jgi:hypothetical protein